MKRIHLTKWLFLLPLLPAFLFGCGYTTHSMIPENIRSIHVDTVINKIPVEEFYAYQQGMEMPITNAIIRRLQVDGNLRVVPREEADVVLETHLTNFVQEGLRFTSLESVEEFRVFIVLTMRLVDVKSDRVLWEEPNFSGDAEYFVSNVRSVAREEAVPRAIDRLARNVVDRIVEDW